MRVWEIMEGDVTTDFRVARKPVPGVKLGCFMTVKLLVPKTEGGVTFPAGIRGTIVDEYSNGDFGIDVSEPTEYVITVGPQDIERT